MSQSTEAAVLVACGQPLQVMELQIPALQSGQVLVDVAVSGLCHSQLHEVRGRRGKDAFLPHVLGHEAAGVVKEIGSGVTKVRPGDHVVLTWIKASGCDVPATRYESAHGTVNSGAIATLMRTTVVSENRLVRVPSSLGFDEAALLGCAIPTGAGAVLNSQVQRGDSIAVWGLGGVGLSAVLAAAYQGVATIIGIDVHDEKLDTARAFGATHGVNSRTEDAVAAVMRITAGGGVTYAIECIGRPQTIEQAFASVSYRRGECIIAGNPAHGERIQIDPFDLIKGRRLRGTWGGETIPDRDIPRFAEMCLDARWDIGRLVSHTFSLSQINEACDALERGEVRRALVRM